tara:strand:- start:397 stop:2679 length:2283 start_codon:yes stop_codon:yes gene_type:complete
MPVLAKDQLKLLFEAGDLITQTTLYDFIDASYNPTLVGGTDIQLVKVSTAAGDTITINSLGGGGGDTVTAGSGIKLTPVGSDEEISINLDNTQTNLIVDGNNKLTFAGLHIKDEGTDIGTYKTINFVGADVLAQDSGTPGTVNVFIPVPTFASHFNTTDGSTNGTVSEGGFTRSASIRISDPQNEGTGTPFKTGGWAGTNHPAFNSKDPSTPVPITFTTSGQVTGFSDSNIGNANINVIVYDADGVTELENFTTNTIFAAGSYNSPSNRILVNITNFQNDANRKKADVQITVNIGDIFTFAGRSGGRFHVKCTMTTDSTTDSGASYSYTQPEIFWDANNDGAYPSTPQINGSVTIIESTSLPSIITKYLSGVEYYDLNSRFEINVNSIDKLNSNTQGQGGASNYNLLVEGTDYGLTPVQEPAWDPTSWPTGFSLTGWTNDYDASNISIDYDEWDITTSNWRFRNTDATIKSKAYDPWLDSGFVNSNPSEILIDTYGVTSDKLTERFDDEAQRLTRSLGSYQPIVSSSVLASSGLANQTTSTISTGPFCQSAVVGGTLVRPDKFYADDGNSPLPSTVISNLTGFAPVGGGGNPDYDTAAYGVTSTYHRLFEVSSSSPNNLNRPFSAFELTFSGDFGTSSDALAALSSNKMLIYVRPLGTSGSTSNIGYNAIPYSVHGQPFFGLTQDPPTSVDAPDNSAQIRTTIATPFPNVIDCSFGSIPEPIDGFYIEVHLIDEEIKLGGISAKIIFSAGSPASESGGSV